MREGEPSLPPPFRVLEDLERAAASRDASRSSAWWISSQVAEHVLSAVAEIDSLDGEPLPQSLLELLERVGRAVRGRRPFPRDPLFIAAEVTLDPLTRLLDHHRSRIVRSHEQLPFHRLREMDTRSMTWLARRPGRTFREKLAGRTRALGVRRELTADTAENRLVRAFARLLVRRGNDRLAYVHAYDNWEPDRRRIDTLRNVVRVCDVGMRHSELAEAAPVGRIRPNNVLLRDPLYSKVFRAWKWLRNSDDRLRRSWPTVMPRVRVALFWMTAARLAASERVTVADTLARVALGRDDQSSFGIEILGFDSQGPSWQLNPPLHFLVVPQGETEPVYRVRLFLEGEFVKAHVASLKGKGFLHEESVATMAFEMEPDPCLPMEGRGFPVTLEGSEGFSDGHLEAHADLQGLWVLADRMVRQVLERCGSQSPAPRRPAPRCTPSPGAMHVGIELGHTALHLDDGGPREPSSGGWSIAVDAPETRGRDWLEGRIDRGLVSGSNLYSIRALGDVLDPEADTDPVVLGEVARRILQSLSDELDVRPDVQVAYAVPDSIDEFSQRTIRTAAVAFFPRSVPVWRSVAGAVGFLLYPDSQRGHARRGDRVVVVDTEFSGITVTMLVAGQDQQLERQFPASGGIYWERRPPLPSNERFEMLGWSRLLRAYGKDLLVEAASGELGTDEHRQVVDDLLRSGALAHLVRDGGSVFAQLPPGRRQTAEAVKLVHDIRCFEGHVGRWIDALVDTLRPEIEPLLDGAGNQQILLIGGPCNVPDFAERGTWQLSDGLRRNVSCVETRGIAAGARECLRRVDSGCIAWKEWLPDLSLEVVRDGHYGEISLLQSAAAVDPFFGTGVEFMVPDTLGLAKGQPWFSFPLMVGTQTRRPLAWEARLESPAFPLDHDVRAVARLSYRYGQDTSYRLHIEPANPEDGSFAPLEAKWVPSGDSPTLPTPRDPPQFPVASWDRQEADKFIEASTQMWKIGDERFKRFLFAVTRSCWSQGRSLSNAPPGVRSAFQSVTGPLLSALQSESNPSGQVPEALEFLALFHEDAPDEAVAQVLAFEQEAGDDLASFRRLARVLATIIGAATGSRAQVLQRLLDRLTRHGDFGTFNPAMANATLEILGRAAWRHPGLVDSLADVPNAAFLLVHQCRRTLQNLLVRVPAGELSQPDREEVFRRYGKPFRNAAEVLLALLRLDQKDDGEQALRCGTASASAIAKAVRQLDARFARAGIVLPWRLELRVSLPESLRRMSPVAFVLNNMLSDVGGANLVQVLPKDQD